MSDTIEVRVPDIGDFNDVPVIEVLVKTGDRVKKNDSLITLESEKASMEVPAESEGVVQDVKVKVGDKVSQGTPILVLSSGAAETAKAPEVATASETAKVSSAAAASAAPATIEVRVPDIGDFKDVPVIEVLVKAGDRVKKNDSLITLESEKASMEVPAQADGIVQDVKVKVGDKVAAGTPILVLSSLQAAQPAAQPQGAFSATGDAAAATYRGTFRATAGGDRLRPCGAVGAAVCSRARRRASTDARHRTQRTRYARRRARIR
jgi:pyruvate/2-oxoglutarate dehydrogenase complex dihydrolipoamide acyltransferase (E2) component